MNVFRITDPIPRGTTVLEASAGTGKTWTIAALATRLIAEGTYRITDLLIVTFTRAATQELRSRVRSRLADAAATLADLRGGRSAKVDQLTGFLATGTPWQGESGAADPASLTLLPEAELSARIDRLTRAIAEIDAATIETIHGFCRTVLEGIGIVGDTDTGLELVESAEELTSEVVADLYLGVFSTEEGEPAFDYATALTIADLAIKHPGAHLAPERPPAGVAGPAIERRVRFATAVRAEVERRKRDLGILTYDDLLIRLARTLEGEGLGAEAARTRLRERWRMVLIDEFQDTDDTQWRIIKTAFHGKRDLILIGDPKQAIYAFRGGDINTYLAARRSAEQTLTLARNYRSDAPLIASVNGLLAGAALGHPEIQVHEVTAGTTDQAVRLAGEDPATSANPERIRLRVIDAAHFTPTRRGYPPQEALRKAIARDVAVDIAHLINGGHRVRASASEGAGFRPAEERDIAVLCHSNRDAGLVHAALGEVGIHSVLSGGTSVFASGAADAWLALLDGMDQPGNVRAVNAAALSDFFHVTTADLVEAPEEIIDVTTERLRHYSHLLTEHGVAAVFEAAQGWGSGGLAARVLRYRGGERVLTDLRHLAELMQGAHPRANANTLATWIREQRERNGQSEEHLRRLESDASAVHLVTIHAAKGLQYPFVYLPFVGMMAPGREDYPMFFADSRRVINVSGVTYDEHQALARAERVGENLRLLYVAMTRAQGQVVAHWVPSSTADGSPLNQVLTRTGAPIPATTPAAEVSAELTRRWGQHLHAEVVRPRQAPEVTAAVGRARGPGRSWTRTLDDAWRRTSYTALSSAAQAFTEVGDLPGPVPAGPEPEIDLRTDEEDITVAPSVETDAGEEHRDGERPSGEHVPSPMAELPMGAQFGSLVHAILETVDTRAPDLTQEIDACVRAQLLQWPLELDPDLLTEAIHAVLTSPLAPVPTTLAELDPSAQLAELDFEIPLEGGQWASGPAQVTLRDLAPLLRRHLPEGDPLHPYAQVVDTFAYQAQHLRGYLTGSIDLVFRHEGRFYVSDYKTNWLGPVDEPLTTAAYQPENLQEAMTGSSYPLQALLYAVALHRYLRWRLPGYDPARHIGGVVYLYVRGMAGPNTPVTGGHAAGVFFWQPPPGLIVELSDLLDGRPLAGQTREVGHV